MVRIDLAFGPHSARGSINIEDPEFPNLLGLGLRTRFGTRLRFFRDGALQNEIHKYLNFYIWLREVFYIKLLQLIAHLAS